MSVRCFVAIELPESVRRLFNDIDAAIRNCDERWRGEKWVAADNLHITLKFVGHIAENDVGVLLDACHREISPVAPFEIVAQSVRAVPGGKPRMLWGAFSDPSGACQVLAEAAERAALDVGVEPEHRSFKPHVTLVRARTPHGILSEALAEGNDRLTSANPVVSVTAATVFQSKLSNTGPTYIPLATIPLEGTALLR